MTLLPEHEQKQTPLDFLKECALAYADEYYQVPEAASCRSGAMRTFRERQLERRDKLQAAFDEIERLLDRDFILAGLEK